MPKEQITFSQVQLVHHNCGISDSGGDACTCTPTADTWPALLVHWNQNKHDQGGNVQISLIKYKEPSFAEWLNDVANRPADSGPLWALPEVDHQLYSAVMTRSEINDLIRTLKRARDQAYGRDE